MANLPTIEETQNVFAQIGPALRREESFTYPLMCEEIGKGRLKLFASCFFINLDGSEYLVSAAHALRKFDHKKNLLLTRNSALMIEIPVLVFNAALDANGKDHLDMVVIKLEDGFFRKYAINVIDASMFLDLRLNMQSWGRAIFGYPESRNKSILSRRNRLHLHVQSFSDEAVDDDESVP
ncbi:hypothetical protein WJ542_07300 [Paraburkholderia sp. B3]|uniref:hypothetical protein n=1 Tax=Paraburkholderia sp. B3 TaxID=3134791 RepID=UPI00398286C2